MRAVLQAHKSLVLASTYVPRGTDRVNDKNVKKKVERLGIEPRTFSMLRHAKETSYH
jgi:hypothetical protein